jgi:hypothetical protein
MDLKDTSSDIWTNAVLGPDRRYALYLRGQPRSHGLQPRAVPPTGSVVATHPRGTSTTRQSRGPRGKGKPHTRARIEKKETRNAKHASR